MRTRPLGDQELAVLAFVSEHAPVTVRQVADYFAAAEGLARTTILTVMERLRRKGYLDRDKTDGPFRYSPTTARRDLLRTLVSDFTDRILGGSVQPFIAYLAEEVEAGDRALEELKGLVRQLERRRREGRR